MNVLEAIQSRYSVRSFLDEGVAEDKLTRVLEAGILAPSGRNVQEYKFVVVRDADTRAQLAEASEQAFVAQAPVVIAIVSLDPVREMYCGVRAGPVDCAIAMDHMTLAAVEEGLGSCWIGHFDQDKARGVLGVPDSAKIIEMLIVGYPADPPGPKKRKSPEELVCWEKFS